MTTVKEFQLKMPCDDCIHNKVCNVRECFEETKIETSHPFIIIKLDCTERFVL